MDRDTIPAFLLEKPLLSPSEGGRGRSTSSFLDKGIAGFSDFIRTTFVHWDLASRNGLLQRRDPRVKLVFTASVLIATSLGPSLTPQLAFMGLLLLLVLCSRLDFTGFYRRIVLLTFVFGVLLALPSALNLFSGGEVVLPLLKLPKSYDFLTYHVPETVGLTREGITGVLLLSARVMNSLTATFLLLATTPFHEVIRALKIFRVPDTALLLLTLTYKYLFIFGTIGKEMYVAKKSRVVGTLSGAHGRAWLAGRIALLFRKSQLRAEEVYKAMVARGFSGTFTLKAGKRMSTQDWLFGAGLCGIVAIISFF